MATQYSNKPIVTDGLVYALDFGNPKSYVSGSTTANSLLYNPVPARFETLLPGDIAPPAAAYSVRKVVSSYTGSAMMVQSASVSQSIGFDTNGNLDTGSLLAFAGSGNAFVKIWYDQSGNGRHVSQNTAFRQPKIVNTGNIILENNKPGIQFDGINDKLLSSNLTLSQPLTLFVVNKYNNTNTQVFISLSTSQSVYANVITGPNQFRIYYGAYFSPNPVADTQQHLFYSLANGPISQIGIDNQLTTTGNAGTNSANIIEFGWTSTDNGFYSNNNAQEIIIYNSNQSSNRTYIESNINSYYNIFTPTADPTPDFDSGILNFESPDSLLTNQSFPGFSYDQGNSTIMYVGETKGTSSLFTQDTNLSVISTTSSVGFGSTSNNIGRTYPVTGLKHVTLRFSSGSVDCFVNGIPVPANSIFPTGSSVAGGKFAIPVYTGSLGLVQVYNRPLTGDEIWNNYQLTAPRYGLGPLENKPYTLDDNAYLFLSQSGITDPIITGSIDTFVRGLKSNNLWDKMIAIYPFVGTGSDGVNLTGSHKWNLKEPSLVTYPLSFTGSWNGSTSGSAPSGSNTNISTQVAPSSHIIHFLIHSLPISQSYPMIPQYQVPT
jgi:hypothetical protein